MGFLDYFRSKTNPVQSRIKEGEGDDKPSTQTRPVTINKAFKSTEIVNRCINLLVDNSSLVEFDVGEQLPFTGLTGPGLRKKQLDNLLRYKPNPYQDASSFRRVAYLNFLYDGNTFIYYDKAGPNLYILPSLNVRVVLGDKKTISHYVYDDSYRFEPEEIIHIADNSLSSSIRGDSRINSALDSLTNREAMTNFQRNYFDNGAVIGLFLETEGILSDKLKDRKRQEVKSHYNPRSGNSAGGILILDNGLKAKSINQSTVKDVSISEDIVGYEEKVALALGVPYILLQGGNNANIRPNIELLFSLTIMPMIEKFVRAFELFFAYDLKPTTYRVLALAPDLKLEADRLSALVNNGIMTPNEAREALRLQKDLDPNSDKLRIPANIAGSATGVSGQQGGKPKDDTP